MHCVTYILGWALDVLAISLAVAIFEIVLEKDQGWASARGNNFWGRPIWIHTWFSTIFEKQYVTVYHLGMFGVAIPGALIAEWLALRSAGIALPLLSIVAAWLAITAVEDFLWFVLNWYYPSSLRDLLAGKIWWHTRWVRLGSISLPRFYLWTPVASLILLLVGAGAVR